MSDVIVTESYLEDIADAIRDRNGTNQTYKIHQMDEAIRDLHNVNIKKWIRPSDFPDYSKIDLTDQEVIYLTYDCTYKNINHISILVGGAYTIKRGTLNNGIFNNVSSTDMASGATFQETLPSNEGDYVVYQITPQEGSHITNFRFVSMTDPDSNYVYYAPQQPCVERYCNVPYHTTSWGNSQPTSNSSHVTWLMLADTIIGAKPNESVANSYRTDTDGALRYVNIENCSFANVTSLQYLFYYNYGLQELYIPHDIGTKCTITQGMFQNCERLVFLDLTGWNTSNITNFSAMFSGCTSLCEIVGIENFNFTKATNLSSMFTTCRMLNNLDTSKWQTTTALTSCASMFSGCMNIKSLDLSGFVTDNVTTFANMFTSCSSLVEIDLTNFVISNKVTTLAFMFQHCTSLRKIIRNKNWNTSNVTTFVSMFHNCRTMKTLDISDFVFSKATTIKEMFNGMRRCQKIIANINLSALTAVGNIATFANNCYSLGDVSELIFTNCIYMPYFGYCRSLKTIKIPSSVTTIPNDTFRDCYHLALVDCRDCTAVPTLSGANAFILNSNTKQKIVVPDALYDEWIAATNWSNATLVTRIIKASDYEASLAS